MEKNKVKTGRRLRRKYRIRKRMLGTPERPRLSVHRSNQHIYAQVINDVEGRTLAAASSAKLERGSTVAAAEAVGRQLAETARSAGLEQVAFDRSGYRYHGRVKALANAAREGGLEF